MNKINFVSQHTLRQDGDNRIINNFIPSRQLINKPDYRNTGELVHNNLKDNILSTHLIENKIYIDSGDRDQSIYTNPFNFTVYLKPDGASRIVNKRTGEIELIQGTPKPYLPYNFKNVKYVQIDKIILPVYYQYQKSNLSLIDISNWINYYNSIENYVSNFRILDGSNNLITGNNSDIGVSIDDMINNDSDFTVIDSDNITNSERLSYINTRLIATDHLLKRNRENDPLSDRIHITRMYNYSLDYDYFYDVDNETWSIYTKNTTDDSKLYDDRYVILKIDELVNNKIHGTNNSLETSFGLITPDRQFSDHYYQGLINQSAVIQDDSDLLNLNKLTFKFYLSDGTLLKFSHLSNDAYSIKDPRHPLHKHLQIHVSMVVGVINPLLNKEIQFFK
jgi:hypothetical protein